MTIDKENKNIDDDIDRITDRIYGLRQTEDLLEDIILNHYDSRTQQFKEIPKHESWDLYMKISKIMKWDH